MVIGGADIFAQAMPRATRLELTEVHAMPEGDTRMAPVDPAAWEETARTRHAAGEGDSAAFTYVTYRRRSPSQRL
jgi:dihydrofolate reductase